MQRVQNYMAFVDKLQRDYNRGMPDGLDEQYLKQITYLFKRIQELEVALAPFAYTHYREGKFGGKVYSVNVESCQRAGDVLDPNNAMPIPVERPGIPAQ